MLDAVIDRFGANGGSYFPDDNKHFIFSGKVQISEKFYAWVCSFGKKNEEGKNDVTGNYYEFVRNPYYWKTDAEGKQLPYMDTLAYTRISDLSQRLLLTINGSLSISEADVTERQTVEESAKTAGYTVVEWPVVKLTEHGVEKTDEVKLYAVDVNLRNFPTNAVYCTDFNGWNMARCHLWYLSDVD